MTKRKPTSQAEAQPVDKPKRRPARVRYRNLSGFETKVPVCPDCGASRYSIGTGTTTATMFTPHVDSCPMPVRVFNTSERFADYARRKATFLLNYESFIRP
jgi:hypothetical protein